MKNSKAKFTDADIAIDPGVGDIAGFVDPTAVAAIRKAFTLSNQSRDNWAGGQRYGRLDRTAGARIAAGNLDVYRRRADHSSTKVRLAIVLDASVSMHAAMDVPDPRKAYLMAPYHMTRVRRCTAAAIFASTMIKALGHVPTVRMDVYQHAAGLGDGADQRHPVVSIKHRWSPGTPVAVMNGAAKWGPDDSRGSGGNADGHALMAIGERLVRETQPGERPVVMVVSDGLPSVHPLPIREDARGRGRIENGNVVPLSMVNNALTPGFAPISQSDLLALAAVNPGMARGFVYEADGTTVKALTNALNVLPAIGAQRGLADAITSLRARGVTVLAVDISHLDESVPSPQIAYYGTDYTVPFVGNWTAVGRRLAKVVGAALATPATAHKRRVA